MKLLKSGKKLLAMVVPAVSVMGVYADDVSARDREKYINPQNSVQVSSSQMGLTGPLEIGAEYSHLYGPIFTAQYTAPLTENQAVSLLVEGGPKTYRISGTYGVQMFERHRFKVSVERLAQDIDFTFRSGNERHWVGQNAVGAAYQYVVPNKWITAVNASGYYAKSENKNLDPKLYNVGTAMFLNERRIAGADAYGAAVGIEGSLWKWSRIGVDINYDNVRYNTQLGPSSSDTQGFGATVNAEQLITETLKVNATGSFRQPFNEVSAGLSWLASTKPGRRIEVGVYGSYLQAKTTDRNDGKVGLSLSYRWDGNPKAAREVYSLSESGTESLTSWTSKAAVYMPEVLAVADERVTDILVSPSSAPIPDVVVYSGDEVNEDFAQHFSSPFNVPMTFSSKGEPEGFTVDPKTGAFAGTAPYVEQETEFPIFDVTGSSATGKTTQKAKLIVKPKAVEVYPPYADPIPAQTMTENTFGEMNVAKYFHHGWEKQARARLGDIKKNPEAKSKLKQAASSGRGKAAKEKFQARKNENAAGNQRSGFKYELINVPADVDANIDPNTGRLYGTASITNEQKSIKLTVRATDTTMKTASSAQNFVDADVEVTVIPTGVTATDMPAQTKAPGDAIDAVDLNSYFTNSGEELKLEEAEPGSLQGLRIEGTQLVGNVSDTVGEYTVRVKGTNENGKSAVSNMQLKVEQQVETGDITVNVSSVAKEYDEEIVVTENLDAQNIFTDTKGEKLSYWATGIDGSGLSVKSDGTLMGTTVSVDQDTDFKGSLHVKNESGIEKSVPITVKVKNVAGEVNANVSEVKKSYQEEKQVSEDLAAQDFFTESKDGNLTYSAEGIDGSGLSVNSAGVLTGTTVTVDKDTDFTGTLTATNEQGVSKTIPFTVTVENVAGEVVVNKAEVSKSYDEEVAVSEDLTADNIFSDTKDEKLTYRAEGIDGSGLTVNADGTLSGTTVKVDKDTEFTGTLYAKNESGDEKAATLKVTVKDVSGEVTANVAEVKKSYQEEKQISEDLAAQEFFTDSKDGKLSYSAEGIDGSGLSVNSAGVLTGTTVTVDKDTDFTGTLTATNEQGVSKTIPFTVTVENVPGEVVVNQASVAKSYDEETNVSEDLTADNIFSDTKDEKLTYRAEGIDGSGLTVNADGTLSGTTVKVNQDTEFTGTLYAKNESGDEKAATFKVTVKNVAGEVVVNKAEVSKTYDEEVAISEDLTADNIFSDTKDEKLTYRAEGIDGSGLTVNADGTLTGTTVKVDKDTEFTGTLYAKNESGDEKAATLKIKVKDVAGEVTANVAEVKKSYQEEKQISEDLAAQDFFTDSKGGKLTYSAEGIDGSGLSVNAAGVLTGTTVTVDKDTDFTGTLTATNEQGVSKAIPFTVTVENVPGEVVVNQAEVSKSYDEEVAVSEDLTADNIFSDTKDEKLTYRAEGIDGSGLTVNADGTLSGTTVKVDKDTDFTGTLYAKNESGDEKAATFKVTVKNVAGEVVVNKADVAKSYNEGAAVSEDLTADNIFSDTKDEKLTYRAEGIDGSGLTVNADGTLSGTTVKVDKDTDFTGTLYAQNESGDEKSANIKITVKNIPDTVNFEASFPKRVFTVVDQAHNSNNPLQNIPKNISKSDDFDVTYDYIAASGSKMPPGTQHNGNGLLTSPNILPNDGVMGGMFDDKAYSYDVIAIVRDKATGKELARESFEVCVGQNRNQNVSDLKSGKIPCEKPPF